MFTIYEAPKLDPITVILQDIEQGKGRLIVECYSDAWAGFWGGMGNRTITQFLLENEPDYIIGRMMRDNMTVHDEAYLMRIVTVVHEALKIKNSTNKSNTN